MNTDNSRLVSEKDTQNIVLMCWSQLLFLTALTEMVN